jgi:tetratricopeptide (TPR) repeat protein
MSDGLRIFRWAVLMLWMTTVTFAVLAHCLPQTPEHRGAPSGAPGPAEVFQQGQMELEKGQLKRAETSFLRVTRMDARSAAAFANLGVVYMREKQWDSALRVLKQAQQLDPRVSGIRLNIGLAYFRQSKYSDAIPPFESVVRDAPDSTQARYLLGLCYFFTQNYPQAVEALQPVEAAESHDLTFLYVLAIAAWKAKQPEIEQSAMTQLIGVGNNSAEFHLFMGKAHLNREEYDDAIKELQLTAQNAPQLPFLHFNLGRAYLQKHDLDHARAEFLTDSRIEPDVAYNYDQLGVIEFEQKHMKRAKEYFQSALRLDPKLASSHYYLARIYKDEGKNARAQSEANAAAQLAPGSSSVHYLRGRILLALGRKREAEIEMVKVRSISDAELKRDQEALANSVADPELVQSAEP